MNFELIDQEVKVLTSNEELIAGIKKIETMGRICYQSEAIPAYGETSYESALRFVSMLIGKHHESVLEHFSLSFIITTDRAVTHQLVRHRLCAFSQESQRFCNYSLGKFGNKVLYIKPCRFDTWAEAAQSEFLNSLQNSTNAYFELLKSGRPEEARAVLPNACKTQIGVTTNLRELRHILKERCSAAAQPQIRQIALAIKDVMPVSLVQDIQDCRTIGRSNIIIPTEGIVKLQQ